MLDFGFYNMDCMEGMKEFPDNYFDLAIVDPPYGKGDNVFSFEINLKEKYNKHKLKKWNNPPTSKYFTELKRVSKNQIIWGANHFCEFLSDSRGWIFWDKKYEGMHSFSDGELAFTSLDCNLRKFTYRGAVTGTIHPTQKPVALYRWLLQNYAQQGWKILDTHVGSASSLIACEWKGFDYVGFELDKDYYEAAQKRMQQWRESRTIDMFEEPKNPTVEQEALDLS